MLSHQELIFISETQKYKSSGKVYLTRKKNVANGKPKVESGSDAISSRKETNSMRIYP